MVTALRSKWAAGGPAAAMRVKLKVASETEETHDFW